MPPIVALLLLAYAPGFRRSALRALPHGHLRWRGDEYLPFTGQSAGLIDDVLPAAEIVARVVAEAEEALSRSGRTA